MKVSVCGSFDQVELAAQAGFDAFDPGIPKHFSARIPEEEFQAMLPKYLASPLPFAGGAGLFPADMHLTGPEADMDAIKAFIDVTMRRAGQAHLRCAVFGSGAARKVPEGFDWSVAAKQIVEVGKYLAEAAAKNNVIIVQEPLNHRETNTFNTVAGGAMLVHAVNHPNFRLLNDYYHFAECDNDLTSLALSTPLIAHTHIATAKNRLAPGQEESDFSAWMHALKANGYDGVIAIEGKVTWELDALKLAVKTIREAWEQA
ncbi:MAG: sugar phosphate isomerase/epimerase [Victivallales bacterium]|nr:sugar phosphate isomerase/epimerase [Victivallales bacterium]